MLNSPFDNEQNHNFNFNNHNIVKKRPTHYFGGDFAPNLPFDNNQNHNEYFNNHNIVRKTQNSNFKDFTPNFNEIINIEKQSIGLALSVLQLSKNEYDRMSIEELKSFKKINIDYQISYAVNILSYYKQNSKLLYSNNNENNYNF